MKYDNFQLSHTGPLNPNLKTSEIIETDLSPKNVPQSRMTVKTINRKEGEGITAFRERSWKEFEEYKASINYQDTFEKLH